MSRVEIIASLVEEAEIISSTAPLAAADSAEARVALYSSASSFLLAFTSAAPLSLSCQRNSTAESGARGETQALSQIYVKSELMSFPAKAMKAGPTALPVMTEILAVVASA